VPRPSGAGATRHPCLSRGIGPGGTAFWGAEDVGGDDCSRGIVQG
jgi:hypothetical protein